MPAESSGQFMSLLSSSHARALEDYAAVEPGHASARWSIGLVLTIRARAISASVALLVGRTTTSASSRLASAAGLSSRRTWGAPCDRRRGLQQAGISRSSIVVWDREWRTLREAGYTSASGPLRFARSITRRTGSQGALSPRRARVLIWGDLSFRSHFPSSHREALSNSRVSSESHMARLLSREVTRHHRCAEQFKMEPGCGGRPRGNVQRKPAQHRQLGGRLRPASRFILDLADLFSRSRIGPKVTFHCGRPAGSVSPAVPLRIPNYMVQHRTLYAGRDPVAIDATLLRGKIEDLAPGGELPAIGERAGWLKEAQSIGLGYYEESRHQHAATSRYDPLRIGRADPSRPSRAPFTSPSGSCPSGSRAHRARLSARAHQRYDRR